MDTLCCGTSFPETLHTSRTSATKLAKQGFSVFLWPQRKQTCFSFSVAAWFHIPIAAWSSQMPAFFKQRHQFICFWLSDVGKSWGLLWWCFGFRFQKRMITSQLSWVCVFSEPPNPLVWFEYPSPSSWVPLLC